jgi:hypothetical protein
MLMTFPHTRRKFGIRSMDKVNDSRRNGYILTIRHDRMTTHLHEYKPKRYWIQEHHAADSKINTDPRNAPVRISVLACVRIIIISLKLNAFLVFMYNAL